MSLTGQQLDTYCGGPPTEIRSCLFPGCDRIVAYYSPAYAWGAMRRHVEWVHTADLIPAPTTEQR